MLKYIRTIARNRAIASVLAAGVLTVGGLPTIYSCAHIPDRKGRAETQPWSEEPANCGDMPETGDITAMPVTIPKRNTEKHVMNVAPNRVWDEDAGIHPFDRRYPGEREMIKETAGRVCRNRNVIDSVFRNELPLIIMAIRTAENGGRDREYGIIPNERYKKDDKIVSENRPYTSSAEKQANWATITIVKRHEEWRAMSANEKKNHGDFIGYVQSKYCPIGAPNDPKSLNRHWQGNVREALATYKP